MMSTKTQKINGQLKNPYSDLLCPFRQQKLALNSNVQALRSRFPQETSASIQSLLEELDNNLCMAIEILEEKRGGSKMIPEFPSRVNQVVLADQNKLLKSAIVRLYKKLITSQRENEQLQKNSKRLSKENEDLKSHNRYLLEKEFNEREIEMDDQVY